jgi:hypothetical protein
MKRDLPVLLAIPGSGLEKMDTRGIDRRMQKGVRQRCLEEDIDSLSDAQTRLKTTLRPQTRVFYEKHACKMYWQQIGRKVLLKVPNSYFLEADLQSSVQVRFRHSVPTQCQRFLGPLTSAKVERRFPALQKSGLSTCPGEWSSKLYENPYLLAQALISTHTDDHYKRCTRIDE